MLIKITVGIEFYNSKFSLLNTFPRRPNFPVNGEVANFFVFCCYSFWRLKGFWCFKSDLLSLLILFLLLLAGLLQKTTILSFEIGLR